jgi:hypothetical protein
MGVGCLSPTDCLAVGPYYPPEQPGLGVAWDGKRWRIALPERGRWPAAPPARLSVGRRGPKEPGRATAGSGSDEDGAGPSRPDRWRRWRPMVLQGHRALIVVRFLAKMRRYPCL